MYGQSEPTMVVKRDQDTSPRSKTNIPIVDLSNPEEEHVVHAVVKAAEEWGSFQVVNHGIPEELMERLKEVGRQFFALPTTEKEAVAVVPDSGSIEGYGAMDSTRLESWNGHLIHKIWPHSRINYRFWPKYPPDYSEVNEEYARHVTYLSEKIMGCLSKGLGLGHEALEKGLGGGEYTIRINYYQPDSAIGAPAHTDFAALALLVSNGVPGLQVFKDNTWFDVECIDSAVVVLLGDQIMRMSNGRYKSVLHRSTMDKEKTRMTWPVLVDPLPGVVVGPLTGLHGPPKFESLTFEDYIYRKTNMLLCDG